MEPLVVGGPEVQPETVLGGQILPQGDVCQAKILRHLCHLGVTLLAGGEELPRLVPHLVGTHALREELVRDPLDGYIYLCQSRVVEGFGIANKGLLRGLKEHEDLLILRAGTLMSKFQRVSLLSLVTLR